jgi:isochorismate synthase/2-succinyl-5-enolpyruvyl-6-hydroxy-3-cyclohexene-1-carboxylate synthase/2-succinyl-6-hydroxy-2,4-cyclohexadiene-1-carboxylate synthase/O-succinylbenzoate synthase
MAAAAVPSTAAWTLLQDAAAAAAVDATSASSSKQQHQQQHPGSIARAKVQLNVQQHQVWMQQVQYEVPSLAPGVNMQVTGLYAHAPPAAGASSGSSSMAAVDSRSNGVGGTAAAACTGGMPVVLLHGFMGSTADWKPMMSALAAAGHPCLAVSLPGHGGTMPVPGSTSGSTSSSGTAVDDDIVPGCYSIAAAAAAVEGAAAAAFGPATPCLLVGYSMGARVVLQLGLQQQQQGSGQPCSRVQWAGAVVISGTPGIPDADLRAARVQKDAELASMLTQQGSARFLEWWYQQPLWASLRQHPGFSRLLQQRQREQQGQEQQLAAALKYGSTGRTVRVQVDQGQG